MHSIRIDQQTVLVVDTNGKLSDRQEEAFTYKAAGKSSEAAALIMGCTPDTVSKHMGKAYVKEDVNNTDNPLALLMSKAFQHGWMEFIACVMVVICVWPSPARTRVQSVRNARAPYSQMFRKMGEYSVGAAA